MIATTDTSLFQEILEFNPSGLVLPTETEIEQLIGSQQYVNQTVTRRFKDLLIRVSTELTPNYQMLPQVWYRSELRSIASQMYNVVGFYYNTDGNISYIANDNGLDSSTDIIINRLHDFTSFQEIAASAFDNDSWAGEANEIRGLAGIGKLHEVTVVANRVGGGSIVLNSNNLEYDRLLVIEINDQDNPEMPTFQLKNNTNEQLKIRIVQVFEHYTSQLSRGNGGYGQNISFDRDGNGTTDTMRINRIDTSIYPLDSELLHVPQGTVDNSIILDSGEIRDINSGQDYFAGGRFSVEYTSSNVSTYEDWDAINDIRSFNFYILGSNPSYRQVNDYVNTLTDIAVYNANDVNSTYMDRFWFFIRKLRQESGSVGNVFYQFHTEASFGNGVKWVDNNGVSYLKRPGVPLWGFPTGFGLAQVDNYGYDDSTVPYTISNEAVENGVNFGNLRTGETGVGNNGRTYLKMTNNRARIVAASKVLWHWKESIDAGYDYLVNEKMSIAISQISEIRDAVVDWNSANPDDLVTVPQPVDYNTIRFTWVSSDIREFDDYNDLFDEGVPRVVENPSNLLEKSFFDAILLKAYNGLGNPVRHFIEITYDENQKPILSIHESATYGSHINYYVRDVANRLD